MLSPAVASSAGDFMVNTFVQPPSKKTEICLFLVKDKVVIFVDLVFCTQYFFSGTSRLYYQQNMHHDFSVGIYCSLCCISFLRLKFFWKDKQQKNKCLCLISPCWCWLYFSRRQRDSGCICFCCLLEDIRAALFTVTELPLLCDIMTANSRAILKCVNSYVYGCRLSQMLSALRYEYTLFQVTTGRSYLISSCRKSKKEIMPLYWL